MTGMSVADIRLRQEQLVLAHLRSGKMSGCRRHLVIVGVCGRSGSGKSTLARMLGQKLRMPFEPLQTDWFRKRDDDPSVPRSSFAWQGPASQDLIAFYDAVMEVAHFLLTSKAGHVDTFQLSTPNFSLQSLRTNKQWSLLDSGGDVTVGLCLEGFVLFDDLQLVNLCHDLVFLDVHWQTACLRRLQRQHGLDCDVTIFFKFWKFYSEIVAPAHDSRVALMTRNLAPRNVIRVIGDCIPEERLEQVLCALRLVEAFDDLWKLQPQA